jgi:two-component system CheB/CheR fusion protein
MEDLALTLETNRMIEREVANSDGQKMLFVRILPYSIPSSTSRGAVTSFVDISAYHDARRLQVILDGLPEHVAVLEPDGTIRMVNAAWRRFALANGDAELRTCEIGSSYLNACGTDFPQDADSSSLALAGLRGVLDGTLPNFSIEYPCHSPSLKRWFVMNVAPIAGPDFGVVVSHFNVTSWFERTAA